VSQQGKAWLGKYRELFGLIMAGEREKAAELAKALTPEAWVKLTPADKQAIKDLGERLYQEKIA